MSPPEGLSGAASVDGSAAALSGLRAAAARDGIPPPERRRALLDALAATMLRRADEVVAAIDADYGGRCAEETLLAEVKLVVDAARHARRHLGRWARPRRIGVPFAFQPARAALEPWPKGIVGIMAPWNYPVQLALLPAVDALAAGNRIAVKPAEATPRTAALLAGILAEAFGPDIARCVQGGPEVAASFAAQPWDHLVFTGGTATGAKVMRAAAGNLVPVTLELGGKCPALVLPGADLAEAARAILAGKAINAGQTCIAPDTVLLVGHGRDAFLAACRATGIARPETAVLNAAQAARLDALCEGATLTPLAPGEGPGEGPNGAPDGVPDGAPDGAPNGMANRGPGGHGRRRALAIAEAPAGHALHEAELFGPVLALVECAGLAQAIGWVAARPPPLAIYLFGASRAEADAVAAGTRSGAIVAGRCVEYAAFPALPFGGVGASGFGRRNGEAGFLEFSTPRARVTQGRFSLARLLDPPRGERARALLRRLIR